MILADIVQGLDPDPAENRRLLKFDTNRAWVSLKNPDEYLHKYMLFQARKYEPPVMNDEPCEDEQTRIMQRRRAIYFRRYGGRDRLNLLTKLKAWPNIYGITTKVSPV